MDIRTASQTCFLLGKEKIRRRYGISKKEIPRFLIAHSRGEPWDIGSCLCVGLVLAVSPCHCDKCTLFFCLVHVYRFEWSDGISFRSRELQLHDDLAGNQALQTGSCLGAGESACLAHSWKALTIYSHFQVVLHKPTQECADGLYT